ncbi:unnamed protein product [Allacma fusca]|uniref:RanBP2-type domain-containing protein n=1 Tax=Allacma fusca TaxID=39272 RepID=A0A8J2LXY8_9HEXA|nr:unnamed protein product [Allacma fusca]
MHKRARLADGCHRPSDDDNSSSGCSSAGPGALRNMIPSPISHPNGRSISGSLFGRPSPTEEQQLPMNRMLSSSRYLPYTIRPLVVRAKRKLQNDSNVHVTSTAQRIINALDNISTPVVNSAKVPYEPFLTSRPVFTPIRRDTHGPPIMKSPLVPSPHGKIMYNPTMHIPRMVDFGTNTDMTMSAFNAELVQDDTASPRAFGGGKMKSVSKRVHAAPLKHDFSTSVPVQVSQGNFVKQPNVESKYKFSRAWSTKDLSGVFQKKGEVKDKLEKLPGVGSAKTVSSSDNGNDSRKSFISNKPDGNQSNLKPLSTMVNLGAGKSWECPTCMVPNKSEATECVCCGTKSPTSAQLPAVAKTWDCPTCMVPNKSDAASCVCCGEKNPSAPAAKPAPKNWDCPTCMVPNKPEAAACVCCSEKNPNKSVTSSSPRAPNSTFQFGFSSSTPKTAAADSTPKPSQPVSSFTFGAPKDTSTPKAAFTFGFKSDTQSASSKVASSSAASTSSFTFGVSKPAESPKSSKISESAVTSTAEPPVKPFTFGSANHTPSKPPISPITFGLPAEPSAATAVKSSPSFSLPNKAPEAAFSPKAAVPLKTSDRQLSLGQPNNGFGSFTFGSSKPSPQTNSLTTSGVIKDDEELWHCKQCPARNRAVNKQCIGCAGPKPPADATSSQPSAGKRYHFDPFFGGKNDDKVDSYSEPEPKRKVPGSGSSPATPSSTGFMYTPPSESTLKLKPAAEAAPPTHSSEIKTGSFLDALKTGSQFTFAAPAPGTSLIPTGPSPSSSTGTTVGAAASSSVPALPSVVSSTSNAGPPSGLFQFGASSSINNTSSAPNLSLPGSNTNNALNQSTFSFGGLKNGPLSSSSSAAPSVFGSPLSTTGTSSPAVFGTPVGNSSLVSPTPPLGTAPATPAPTAPSFNFTPNFNFGGSSATSGSGSFVFTAQPTASPGGPPGDGGMGQRKIRRATRRMQR